MHETASIDNFKNEVEGYKYVLIAAHGYYNRKQPELSGILFSPPNNEKQKRLVSETGKLQRNLGLNNLLPNENIFYTSDAYNLKLNADLVVLSCCESGLGEMVNGEGMLGINRGFLYAGAKNIIFTLFKVYDDVSSELTQSLFKYILAGKNYSESLRLTKLELINEKEMEPMCWAGFVLIGV